MSSNFDVTYVNRVMGKKALQAKWVKAIEEVANIQMHDSYHSSNDEYHTSAKEAVNGCKLNVVFKFSLFNKYDYDKRVSVNEVMTLTVMVLVYSVRSGERYFGSNRFDLLTKEDIKNPQQYLMQCVELFEEAQSFMNDEGAYLNAQIVKQANIRRQEVAEWLEKLTLLMVEGDENPNKEKLAEHLKNMPYDASKQACSDLYRYNENKRAEEREKEREREWALAAKEREVEQKLEDNIKHAAEYERGGYDTAFKS